MNTFEDTEFSRFDNPAWDCWYLTGPTGSGKTSIALPLAEMLNAEIISMDSMAVYKELDVGTAKPTPDEQAIVTHHMIDVVEPSEEYSLARYIAGAHEKIREIRRRGKEVLFVGGTPLYLKGLLRGIFEGPPADKEFRTKLYEESFVSPPNFLHERLKKVDSEAAKRIHPNDTRRLVRALEVFELTGMPLSVWQQQFEEPVPVGRCKVIVLDWPKEILRELIEKRVDHMMDMGFLDEVQELTRRFLPINQTAAQAVGYRELFEYLDGKRSLYETVQLIKQNTRQVAKRQCTWFRSIPECTFFSMHPKPNKLLVAEQISKM
ncbi:MAG: tRNA (adenosine(37)-N6)-dimethylallyltransferase MiaA [Planctomycetaceae bacterium]|nr:tRNA (adenosine(37)-N6)-dimethylallyltransferase MiaA [Planctomycetaceae bacterium]